jgi:hypothetical protein
MTYNHPKRDNCDRESHPVLNVRMFLYVHYYLHNMFHVEHCTYNCCTVSVRVSSAAVDERGNVAGAEAVIDIYYADVGGAGVHHSEQSRQAFEGCAITNAGGNGNYRDSYQASDYAGESAFHAGADYDYAGFG